MIANQHKSSAIAARNITLKQLSETANDATSKPASSVSKPSKAKKPLHRTYKTV